MPETPSTGTEARELPRIGIPFRHSREEQAGDRQEVAPYATAVAEAGGEPRLISLFLSEKELRSQAQECDGVLLPGSPADVDPARYGEVAGAKTAAADERRERTDWTLLDWAFAEGKPVLGICYGTQLLNVYLGGTLVQDIASERRRALVHPWDRKSGAPEPHHPARLVPGSWVARLAETLETVVNSSHHQSVRMPGRNLRVTASAPDGVIEAVELDGASPWIVGVQWHPERQRNEAMGEADSGTRLARALFRELVRAAQEARVAGSLSRNAVRTGRQAEGR